MSILPTSKAVTDCVPARRVMVATSSGIRKLQYIERFLAVDAVVSPNAVDTNDSVEAVVVWGRKETAEPALTYARKHSLDVIFLEDGWIRCASENAHNRRSYSVLVDSVGVYYDASKPSRIEQLLNASDTEFARYFSDEERAYAQRCRRILVDFDITKYNYCKRAQLAEHLIDSDQKYVLVIDQTVDDASVRLGGMDQGRFHDMLDAAVKENPDASIIVRTHPDVVAGSRQGYLSARARALGLTLSASGDNPMPWLKQAHRVYVGTSQIGYEALLCDTAVTVFGNPFYAGWGLSDDRALGGGCSERRTATRTVDELFHVAHVMMARYLNPITGELWQLHECLSHVQLQARYFQKNAHQFHCLGITAWKQGYIRQYLRSPDGSVTFGKERNVGARPKSDAVNVTWSFRRFQDEAATGSSSAQVARIEDGFLRSFGLGSDFTAPGSLVVDATGLYFDPGAPSDLENLLNTVAVTPADVQRAQRLRQRILCAKLSKYNVGQKAQKFSNSADNQNILVVGQVEDDASIKKGCTDIADNTALLRAVRVANPNAYVVYKPHPDVVSGNRKGVVTDPLDWADEVNTSSSITAGLDWCDELHTMTSLSGFEALMRHKKVVTYGMPFYSGWGLTEDRQSCSRRQRRRTLDELVYLTLIEYPRYLDIDSGEFMTAEMMVARLEKQRSEANAQTVWMQRQMTKVVNLVKGCRYAP